LKDVEVKDGDHRLGAPERVWCQMQAEICRDRRCGGKHIVAMAEFKQGSKAEKVYATLHPDWRIPTRG
jgi:hypothetical protein